MRQFCAHTLIMLLMAGAVAAAEPSVETVVTPPEIPWHLPFEYTITVTGDASLHCTFQDIVWDDAQLLVDTLDAETTEETDGRIRITQQYRIDPIFPGYYATPPLTITWQTDDDEGTLTVPPALLFARELSEAELEALAQPAGIASPETVLPDEPISRRLLFLGLSGIFLALLGAGALMWYLRQPKEMPVPALPPWETALNRLRELERRNLPAAGKIDAYYVDLSAILRYYIEDRFHIHAPEQTTPEFLDTAAQSRVFSEEQQAFLSAFLRQCDRVKFARLQPDSVTMHDHFKQVRRFVNDTTPQASEDEIMEHAA